MATSATDPRGAAPAKCRACNRPMNSPLFCANCGMLQSAEGCNHFQLLGLEPTYDLGGGELRRRYLASSRDVHPDRHGTGDEENADMSLRASASLNEAYRVLADPVLRAEYLLELSGGKSSAADKSVPQEVLTRTLMLREAIEEAHAAGDHAALEGCQQQVRQLYDQAVGGIAELARQLPGSDETRQQLRQRLNAVKYYQKLLEKL